MDFSRRGFLRGVSGVAAAVAAAPILAKLPAPIAEPIRRGAMAMCRIVGGAITGISITNCGTGYVTPPTITFGDPT